jgi:hypothetical protein
VLSLRDAAAAHVRTGRQQDLDEAADQARAHQVVVVAEGDQLTGRRIEAAVLGGGDTAVLAVHDHHPVISCGEAVADLARRVGGAVVHQEHLDVGVVLLEDRRDARLDVPR